MLKKESRQQYAEKIAGDLSRLLNPSGKRRQVPVLGFNAASQIEAGMVSGARKIYAKMKEKYENKPMPKGLEERLGLVLFTSDLRRFRQVTRPYFRRVVQTGGS